MSLDSRRLPPSAENVSPARSPDLPSLSRASETLRKEWATHPEVLTLAMLVSMAVKVTPALLREVRLTVRPDLSVAVEARLWRSNLIQSSNRSGFFFYSWSGAALRQLVTQEVQSTDLRTEVVPMKQITGAELESAWRVIERHHKIMPSVHQIQAALHWQYIRSQLGKSGAIEEQRKLLLSVAAAIAREEASAVRWGMYSFPSLEEKLQRSPEGQLLGLAVASRVPSQVMPLRPLPLDSKQLLENLPSVLSRDLPEVSLRVRLAQTSLVLEVGGAQDVGIRFPIPQTQPLLVRSGWNVDGQERFQWLELPENAPLSWLLPEGVQNFTLHNGWGEGIRLELPTQMVEVATFQLRDHVLVINLDSSLMSPPGYQHWEDVPVGRVHRYEPGLEGDFAHRVRQIPWDELLLKEMLERIRQEVLAVTRELTGRLHLFCNVPHGVALWIGRCVEKVARHVTSIPWQFDVRTRQWQPFWPPELSAQSPSPEAFFKPLVMQESSSFESSVALGIWCTQQPTTERLTAWARRYRVGQLYGLYPSSQGYVELQSDGARVLQECQRALEKVRRVDPNASIHLLTSAPVALMLLLGRAIRETVYRSVIAHHYDASTDEYVPFLDVVDGEVMSALPVRIFISYARQDLEHLKALETHLANLKRQGRIVVWSDQQLRPGTEWEPELLEQLRSADIVLVLISPDMMASDFIHDHELKDTLARHQRNQVKLVPVLVRPTDLKGHALDKLQGLPRNSKPVIEWPNPDAAWLDVVQELHPLIEELSKGGRTATSASQPPGTPAVPPVAEAPALTLLHLSDLHFGQARGEGFVHFDQQKVIAELLRDAQLMQAQLGCPDAILVTGDIAFSATPEQYQQADAWLQKLADAVGVGPERIWLVPGNHDVDRGLALKPLGRKKVHAALRANPTELEDYFLKENLGAFREDLWPKLQTFATFAQSWAAPPLTPELPFWKLESSSPLGQVLFLGLNSCLLSLDSSDAKSNLALSKAQLHRLLETPPDKKLVLALMHHPPDWLSDGNELLKELQKYPHILFTGHVHTPEVSILHGSGQNARLQLAAGAAHADPKQPGQHSYAWIRLSPSGLEWHPRTYSERWNAFRADHNRLEESKNSQKFEPNVLPKKLREWLKQRKPNRAAPPRPTLPHPFVPPAWRTWALKEYETLTPVCSAQQPISFRLSQVYVELHSAWSSPAEVEKRAAQRAKLEMLEGKRTPAQVELQEQLSVRPRRRALSTLLQLPGVTLLGVSGGPGSGKSTALRRLLLATLQDHSLTRLPLYLELKDFGAWLKQHPHVTPAQEPFLRWVGDMLSSKGLSHPALEARAGHGRILWLLDGLDEIVPDLLRLRAAQSIGHYFRHASGTPDPVLLTGRPHAFDDAQLRHALHLDQPLAELEPLTDEERSEYLHKWFREVYPSNPDKADEQAQALVSAIPQHEKVDELSRTPLMLSTIAVVFFNGRKLPERRADLYHEAVDLMLSRHFAGHARPGDYTLRSVRRALSVAARAMLLQGEVRSLTRLDFERSLEQTFHPDGMSEAERTQLEALVEWLGAHSGLLALRGDPARYTFSHFGFQEFLCAEWYASQRNPLEALGEKLDDRFWREVVLLTGGRLLKDGLSQPGEEFLESLLRHTQNASTRAWRTRLLATILREAPSDALPRGFAERVKPRFVEVLSSPELPSTWKERVEVGFGLGKLGDPRLGMEKPENWIWIEPSEFRMGDDLSDYTYDKPSHLVEITQGFYLSRFPVTNQDFKPFIDAGGYHEKTWWGEEGWAFRKKQKLEHPGFWTDAQWNAPNQPVVGVSWYEADAFCKWLSAQPQRVQNLQPSEKRNFRLATEAEWELAARGTSGRKYPWGNTIPNADCANSAMTGLRKTSPVGAFPKGSTPAGIVDMSGNVLEWMIDHFSAYTPEKLTNPSGPPSGQHRALRGGSWATSRLTHQQDYSWKRELLYFGGANRGGHEPTARTNFIGFRVVMEALTMDPELSSTNTPSSDATT